MNSYAPIAMPAAAGTTYAPAPVSFTGPAPSTYGATPMMTNGPPIPLTQVLLPSDMLTEEASGVGAGGGGDVTKILALPLLFLLPVFLVVVVVVVVAGGGGGGGGGGFLRRLFGFPPKFQQYEETTPYYDYNGQRKKRTVDSSSGLPVMSLAQERRGLLKWFSQPWDPRNAFSASCAKWEVCQSLILTLPTRPRPRLSSSSFRNPSKSRTTCLPKLTIVSSTDADCPKSRHNIHSND